MGTPRYMSPEQCMGKGQVDDRTDVYSLGVMLFEMLAGRVPFEGTGSGELIAMHLTEEPPALLSLAPQVPPQLAALTHQLLLKDRQLRPSMAQAVAGLGRLRASIGNVGAPAAPTRISAIIPLRPPAAEPQSTLGLSSAQKSSPATNRRWQVLGTVVASSSLLLLAIWGVGRLQPAGAPRRAALPAAGAPKSVAGAPKPVAALPALPGPAPALQIATPPVTPDPPAEVAPPPPASSSPPPASSSPPPASAPPERAAAPIAKLVRWNIASEPAGATVVSSGGKIMGKTPYKDTRVAEAATQVLVLRLEGYEELRLKLSLSADESQKVTLRPSRAGTAAESRKLPAPADTSGLKSFPELSAPARKPATVRAH